MRKKKAVYIIAWIAVGIFAISLFLPQNIQMCHYRDGTVTRKATLGIELFLPISIIGTIPFLVLMVLFYLRQTNFSRWTSLILAIITLFLGIPLNLILSSFSFRCSAMPGLGALLHCISYFVFLVPAAKNLSIPVQKLKRDETNLLDHFDA